MTLIILFAVMVITMCFGIPVAWALGISALVALLNMGLDLTILPQKIFAGIDFYTLLTIPLFIVAGEFMTHGGITERLIRFAVICVGRIRGGLAHANVLASMMFGGITGAAIADASALGSVEIPMMVKSGYDKAFSGAITSASACMGPIIPPSIVVIIYSMAVGGVSIAGLFAAGMVPGILIGLSLMATCYVISVRRKYPKEKVELNIVTILIAFKDSLLALLAPIIVLGGIIGGVFTPTEAAGVAAVYSFFIAFIVYKELKIKILPSIFLRAGIITATVMIIIGTANAFGVIVAFEQLADTLQGLLRPLGRNGFILTVNLIFLLLGMVLELGPAILIFAPVFAPIAKTLGIDPLHFGIIVVMNLVIGLLTPPFGQVLFVTSQIGDIPFEELVSEIFIFIIVLIGILLLVSFVPYITLAIPHLLKLG